MYLNYTYPLLLKVAGGEVSESVQENDIPAELSEEEAHKVYGEVSANYMVLTTPEAWWDGATLQDARSYLDRANQETETFVAPFLQAKDQEALDGSSKWTEVFDADIHSLIIKLKLNLFAGLELG